MKRVIALLATVIALVGCGSGNDDGGSGPGGTTTTETDDGGYDY